MSATNSNYDTLVLYGSNDVVTALGVFDASVTINGSNDVLLFDSGCDFTTGTITLSNLGSPGHPVTIC